jgi:hypothetical protein
MVETAETGARRTRFCLPHMLSVRMRKENIMKSRLPWSLVFVLVFAVVGNAADEKRTAPGGIHVHAYGGSPRLATGEISAKAEIAVSGDTPPEERFEAVRALGISPYTNESAQALVHVACDKTFDETTRDYAGMGLRNFTKYIPDESRRSIQQRLRAALESEKGDTPDGIVRTLIAWNDAPFINEILGDQLAGHTMEIEVLAALPGKESAERLWELYRTAPKSRKSVHYNRRAEIGRALVKKKDSRGIDILIDLLPADRAPGKQYRHNIFVFLAGTLKHRFGYDAEKYDPSLEEAVPSMIAWWEKNKDTFAFTEKSMRH